MDKKVEDLKLHIKLLSERRNLLQLVLDQMQEGILILERGDTLSLYNPAFVKCLDLPVFGAALTLKDLQEHPIFKNILMETKDMDFVHYVRDVEIFSPWKKFLSIRAVRIGAKGESRALVYIVQDTTNTKERQEETFYQKKLDAVLTLGAGVAHEMGNPLNSLGIHLQIAKRMLKKDSLSPQDMELLRKETAIVESETKRMDHIISSFLKATRPERVHYREMDIVRTIRMTVESLSALADRSGVHLEFSPHQERKFLFADEKKIEQALDNIIRNAIEASGAGGKVAVSCKEEEGAFIVKVEDSGPGIPQEILSRIFEPFFTTKEKGVGLGLVISHRIIKEHDGDISVKSSPGKRTEFLIKLPLREYKLKLLDSKKDACP